MPERLLWKRLRDGRCAKFKFRRQHPLGPYVLDYYCAVAHSVVELDGRSHEGRGVADDARQAYLERLGLRVLRFTNDQVLADLDGVVETIVAVCLQAQAKYKAPSPAPTSRGTLSLKGEG